jgi:hypothetical protein
MRPRLSGEYGAEQGEPALGAKPIGRGPEKRNRYIIRPHGRCSVTDFEQRIALAEAGRRHVRKLVKDLAAVSNRVDVRKETKSRRII